MTNALDSIHNTASESGDDSLLDTAQDGDVLYERIAAQYSPALARIAAAYEANPQRRQDLLQDIHFKLWRSLESFGRSCSLAACRT